MDANNIDNNTGNSDAFNGQQTVSTAPVISNDIMIRRAKNRDRQRRYRARKRLELEIKRSCLLGQSALMQNESSMPLSTPSISSTFLVTTEATMNLQTSVYSGRKWKKDAREAHLCKETENLVRVPVMFVKSPSEAEYSIGGHMKAVGRRDWKADARNNNIMETSENE